MFTLYSRRLESNCYISNCSLVYIKLGCILVGLPSANVHSATIALNMKIIYIYIYIRIFRYVYIYILFYVKHVLLKGNASRYIYIYIFCLR